MKFAKYFIGLSIALTLVAVVALSFYGLKLGIDFTGGTVTEIRFEQNFDMAKVEAATNTAGVESAVLQPSGERDLIIKTSALDKEQHDKMLSEIKSQAGNFTEQRLDSIGPSVGKELTRSAFYQLVLVSLGIILYIAYAFRKVQRPITSWRFGLTAVVALLHDLLVVLGIFAVLGRFWNVEVDIMFVTALLTVLGFSVHDTIVVFDRIRENLKVYGGQSLEFVVNHSITQTIVRSLNTTLTVLFVLLALLLFGGETIRWFVLALFIGICTGTYSSIFIASPLLVYWQRWKNK